MACDTPTNGVIVRDQIGRPVAAADVRIHDADGALVATGTTGASGVVEVELPDGGTVTVSNDRREWFRSVFAVAGGEHLHVSLPVEGSPAGSTRVTVPPPPPSADLLRFEARCTRASGSATEFTIERTPCATPTTTVLVTAADFQDVPIAYLLVNDVDLRQADIQLSNAWQPPAGTTAITATAPPGTAWLDVGRAELEDGYPVALEYDALRDGATAMPYAGRAHLALYRVCTADGRCTFRVSAARDAIAVGADDILPRVTNATLAGNTVAWQGGAGGDFAEVKVDILQGTGDTIEGAQTWIAVGPPDVTHVTLPEHPDFRWSMATSHSVSVKIVESSALATYGDVVGRDSLSTDDGISIPVPDDLTVRTSTAFGL